MINVDIKSLLSKLNNACGAALQNAAGLCVSRGHYEVTGEHLLVKLLEDANTDLSIILRYAGIEAPRVITALNQTLEDRQSGNTGKPVFSPILLELMQDAWLVTTVDLGESQIRSGAILYSILSRTSYYGQGTYIDQFKNINRQELLTHFYTIAKGSSEVGQSLSAGGELVKTEDGARPDAGFISRFCLDFTAKADAGQIDPVFGRDAEIRQIVDILARRRKNNPILVGEPGVGKTAVVEGLARRIQEGDVPDSLQGVRILGLDMGLLEAGAGMKGEFENRLKGVIDEVKASEKPIILFIDEAHTLIGAGGQAGGSDAANLLKPALARGELKTLAATTWTEYKKYFEKDPALARRFQLVKLDEPSVETTALILRGLKDSYEQSHQVIIRDEAIEAAATLADRYLTGRFLPDKAIDLLDTTCARVKVNLTSKPAALEDRERSIQAFQRIQKAIERDRDQTGIHDADKLRNAIERIQTLEQEAEALRQRWRDEKDAAHELLELRHRIVKQHDLSAATQPDAAATEAADTGERESLREKLNAAELTLKTIQNGEPLIQIDVCEELVSRVVSDWTGIPLGKVARDQAQTVIDLELQLSKRIKGQDHALAAIAEVIRAAKSGLKNPNQPLGVFLFAGPSGVGKTETGLALADLLFGDEQAIVTINMSEFQEKHTVSRLIGSPPGYVGYGEGGMLTEAVRRKPYSVVLLDEVEKAHLDVMNTFYQVFDKGTLTDGEGKEINFRNTIILLTSNLGTEIIEEMTHVTGDDEQPPLDAVMGAVRPLLSQHFKPALLARMTVIPYFSLDPAAIRRITDLKLRGLKTTLMRNNRMELMYTEAVVDLIAARCTETETGARNIDYILNGNVLPQMSREILGYMASGDSDQAAASPSRVMLGVDDAGAFSLRFE